jgi:biotin operon repressor
MPRTELPGGPTIGLFADPAGNPIGLVEETEASRRVGGGAYHDDTMRRADRLFRIIQLLRGRGRARTARWLAEQLEVSERTVYRDVRDLIVSGTPIEGAAGVGYTLRHYDLPPLMFEAEELEALALGARAVQAFGDESLARSAESALSKIEAVLPQRLRGQLSRAALFAPRHDARHASAPRNCWWSAPRSPRARNSRSATSARTVARANA